MLRNIRRIGLGLSRVKGFDVFPSPGNPATTRLEPIGRSLPEKRGRYEELGGMLSPSERLIQILGSPSSSGAKVTETSALGMGAVTACVTIMANMVAKLPIYLYRSTLKGPQEVSDHPCLYLIGREPSSLHTSFELRHLMEAGKGLGGNGYARVIRDGSYTPTAIQWIAPCDVTPKLIKKATGEKVVAYEINGEKDVLTRADIIHVKLLSVNGVTGVSPISIARESIGTALSQTEAAGKLMRNGAKFPGFLTTSQNLKPDQLEDARNEFNAKYGGAINAGTIPILNGMFDFKVTNGMSMVDAQFIESRKFEIHEVARIYNIPLFMVDSTASTAWGSGIESLNLTFLNNSLAPHLRAWEESLDHTLLTTEEKKAGFYFQFDRDEIANVALQARSAFYTAMRVAGVYSPNDIRAKLGEPLLSAEQGGDTYGAPLASNAGPSAQLTPEPAAA